MPEPINKPLSDELTLPKRPEKDPSIVWQREGRDFIMLIGSESFHLSRHEAIKVMQYLAKELKDGRRG